MKTIKKASVVEIGRIKTEIKEYLGFSHPLDYVCLDLSMACIVATDKNKLYFKKVKVDGELKDTIFISPTTFKKLGSRFIVADGFTHMDFHNCYEFVNHKGESFEGFSPTNCQYPNFGKLDLQTGKMLHFSFSNSDKERILSAIAGEHEHRNVVIKVIREQNLLRFGYDEELDDFLTIDTNETPICNVEVYLGKYALIKALSSSSPSIGFCINGTYKYPEAILLKSKSGANILLTCGLHTSYQKSVCNIEHRELVHYMDY